MPVQALTKRAETDEHRFNQRSALRFQSYCALVRYVCSLSSLSLSLALCLSVSPASIPPVEYRPFLEEKLVFHPWNTILSARRS